MPESAVKTNSAHKIGLKGFAVCFAKVKLILRRTGDETDDCMCLQGHPWQDLRSMRHKSAPIAARQWAKNILEKKLMLFKLYTWKYELLLD